MGPPSLRGVAGQLASKVQTVDPAIAEVAVFGVEDERFGERPAAVVVRRTGRNSTRTRCGATSGATSPRYKVPRDVEFAEALLRTATGKVLERELRRAQPAPGTRVCAY